MLYTEAEAKTKWCPFSKTGMDAGLPDETRAVAGNRYPEGHLPEPCMCIASGCMAWQFGREREIKRNYFDAPFVRAEWRGNSPVYEDGWQYEYTDIDSDGRKFDLLHRPMGLNAPKVGFCGLAGKPE